jgi:hypothetical protein
MKTTVTQFYTCGSLDEPEGLTFHSRELYEDGSHASGSPTKGYKEQVIGEKEFYSLLEGEKTKGRWGVVSKKGLELLQKENADLAEKRLAHKVEANRIKFKLAQRDAKAIGEDHESVFTSKHPEVSEAVKAMLFAEVRAAQAKVAKKGK